MENIFSYAIDVNKLFVFVVLISLALFVYHYSYSPWVQG